MKLERYLIDTIQEKHQGCIPSAICALLWLLSFPYRLAAHVYHWAFDNEWLKQYNPPVPVVVSIGNIVAGGTGKTPLTLFLAKEFYDQYTLGILSRGYRSPAEKLALPVILSAGKGPLHSAAYCGDEPFMISENLPKAHVFVGRDRQKAANLAALAGVELAILDDGMQHRRIGRDYELVILDSEDPFGLNYYLPRGFLREHPRSLGRADLVICNHVADSECFERLRQLVAPYTNAPVVGTRLIFENAYDLCTHETVNLQGKKGILFCGIAHPERFMETVRECGVEILGQEIFPDHAPYDAELMMQLANKYKAKGAEVLICTEKDKVKIPHLANLAIPLVWIKMQLRVVQNSGEWEQFIRRIRSNLETRSPKG